MKIEFTKSQFENLLKLAYLGNWLANAIHDGGREDPQDEGVEEIENYIFSFAKEFGLEEYVEYDEKYKRYFPTRELETLAEEYINDYDESNFWEDLFYRMYERDFNRAYSKKERESMSMSERFEKEEPFREKWNKELEEHGINRFEIGEN